MMELPDKLKLEASIMNVLGPDVNNTSTVASQHELALEPFILNTLVKDTGQDMILGGFTNRLIDEHISIQRVHGDTVATADDDVSCHVVDSSAINCAIGWKSPNEASAIQIP